MVISNLFQLFSAVTDRNSPSFIVSLFQSALLPNNICNWDDMSNLLQFCLAVTDSNVPAFIVSCFKSALLSNDVFVTLVIWYSPTYYNFLHLLQTAICLSSLSVSLNLHCCQIKYL